MPMLYVHVPFCVSKCSYCGFYSLPVGRECRVEGKSQLFAVYLDALGMEAQRRWQDAPQGVSSLFIGGGTPTVFDEQNLRSFLTLLDSSFHVQALEIEKTMESNPGTLTKEKLEVLKQFGINRISLGVQTFSDEHLKAIGRIHRVDDVDMSIKMIRRAGFNNLNLDLMFGLPRQTLDSWKQNLAQAVSYRPEHLSLYALILEEGTPMAIKEQQGLLSDLPDEDLQAEMYEFAVSFLKHEGYIHYETSNFALAGFECKHNLGYWTGKDYLGLGPGAVSCLKGMRFQNIRDVIRYLEMLRQNKDPVSEWEQLTERERMAERVMLGLRMTKGLDLASFALEFGVQFRDIYGEILERYLSQGVLSLDGEHVRINPRYTFVANSVIAEFF